MPKLTDRFLSSFRVEPPRKDRLAFDTECPGLGVRATARGTHSFIVQWTDPATKRKVREPIGVWGSITIEQARTAARARLGDVAKGVDIVADRRRRKAEAEAERLENMLSVETLFADWTKLHLVDRRPRYAKEAVRALKLAFRDYLKRPAARLERESVVAEIDKLRKRKKFSTADRVIAYGRACYSWAQKRGKVTGNPFLSLPISSARTQRDHVLDDATTWDAFDAAETLGDPFGPFYQVAILTLQRRSEVAGMRWSEISKDSKKWTIPGPRMKNGRPHDVHLTQAALDVLERIPVQKDVDLVFSTTGTTPISGFTKAKRELDGAIVKLRKKTAEQVGAKAADLIPWRLHDVRRTGVSKLASLGFDSIVVDKLLAHQPAKLQGVASVYQRHDFAAERARALDVWAAHVTGLRRRENVVSLSARAR
jgi:integrase